MALADLTLGRFYDADSFVHRLDSRTKLFSVLLLIGCALYVRSFVSFLIIYCLLGAAITLSRIPVRYAAANLKFFVWLVALAVLLNLFFTTGTPVLRFGPLSVTKEGLSGAFLALARLTFVVASGSFLTLTTTPLDLTEGISGFFSFLRKLKVPVHELSLMSALALSYIPVMMDEVRDISLAQRSRGAQLDGRGVRTLRSAVSLAIPVLLSTLRKAEKLAQAMEARCFRSAGERTRLVQRRLRLPDYVFLSWTILVVFLAIYLARVWGGGGG